MSAYPASNKASPPPDAELVTNHIELVKRIAHHLLGRLPSTVELDDLMQAGLVGLIEASANYDSGKGASFETYAGIRIRGAMLDEVRKLDWTPRSVHQKQRHVAQTVHALEGELGRAPNEREIAAELGIDLDQYHRILADSSSCRLFSIEQPSDLYETTMEIPDSSGAEPDSRLSDDDKRRMLIEALGQIPERERMVLSLYYERELNLKEIGAVLGVSESRVSQIHSQAIARLRGHIGTGIEDLF